MKGAKMLKLGQGYGFVNKHPFITNTKTVKTEEDAVDTPKGTPTKQELNIGKGDEYRQWTDPKDGGETLDEAIVRAGDKGTKLADAINFSTAYKSLYGAQPNSEESTDDSQTTRYKTLIPKEETVNNNFERNTSGDNQGTPVSNQANSTPCAAPINDYKRVYLLQDLKNMGLSDEDIKKYFNHNTDTMYNLLDGSVAGEADDYSLISKTINGVTYKTEEEAINAIINKHKEKEKSTTSDLTAFIDNDADMFMFVNTNIKEAESETTVAPSFQQLKNMGLSEQQINEYFNKVTQEIENGHVLEAYILKDNININGTKIDSVDKLIEALDVDPDPYRMANNLQELKNWGLTDEEIEEYFDYVESKTDNGVTLSGYIIKKGLKIDDKKVKSFEDLKESLALVDNTIMNLPAIELYRYGFTQAEIDKYFTKHETFDYKGKSTFNYALKRGIKINGQGINSFKELIEILNKKDGFLWSPYRSI